MSPNVPSAYLWIMNQFLLPPLEQLTPPQVAFLGCNCHNINSTDVFQLQALPHPAWDPTRKAGMRNAHRAGTGRKLQWEEPRSLSLQTLGCQGPEHCTTMLQSAREDFSCGPCCTWMGDFVCTKKVSVLQMGLFFIFI